MKRNPTQPSTGERRKASFWLSFLVMGIIVGSVTFGLALAFPSDLPASSPVATETADKDAPPRAVSGETAAPAHSDARNGAANGAANDSFFSRLFENKDLSSDLSKPGAWRVILTKVPLRLMLAALLAALLAYRPKRFPLALPRNPYVAQTQILLAVVAAALMIIVADSAARAFGIFAAASLVRFRTGIRDPKEVTVILICLAIGLGTGVGHLALAVIFTLFVLFLLWVLEYREPLQIFRVLELKIRTRDVDRTHERLKGLFVTHQVVAEIQAWNKQDEDEPRGKIVYRVQVHPDLSTDCMSEELFSADPENVDSIEWQQKKSISYFYR